MQSAASHGCLVAGQRVILFDLPAQAELNGTLGDLPILPAQAELNGTLGRQ